MTETSWFCRAVGSCVWSVMIRKISWSRLGLAAPYHLGFGFSVIEVSFLYAVILYGPPDQSGTFLSNHWNDALMPAGLPSSPCCLAMCAGSRAPNMLCQSANGVFMTTVTVLPLSEEVIDWIAL